MQNILMGIEWQDDDGGRAHLASPVELLGFAQEVKHESDESGAVVAITAIAYESGVWVRRDRIRNSGAHPITLHRPTITFAVDGAGLQIHAMTSHWCAEAQPVVLDLCEVITIGSRGRSCSGWTPYFCIESPDSGEIPINLLPGGDWRACFHRKGNAVEIRIDQFDDEDSLELAPGDEWEFGIACIIGGAMQAYAHDHLCKPQSIPIVYNTWYDRWSDLSWDNLTAQFGAAREVGCEVFMIDAGWFGPGSRGWERIGDWREKPEVFDGHTLTEFADCVRAAGLGFGLWMEPERVHIDAPIACEHPEWCIPSRNKGYLYLDLLIPEARDWLAAEMARVIEVYGLRWMKVDCNHDFCDDPHHEGHRGRMAAWYRILAGLAEQFPDLILEGCAGGGLRHDLLTTSHFHTHFLSDNVDPIDMLRIGMSNWRRVPARMCAKWAVVYPAGGGFTPYDHSPGDTGDLVLCARTADAKRVEAYHLDFVMRAAMTGAMGLSGNLAGLDPAIRKSVAGHIAFYKTWREFILSSIAIPLTPILPLAERTGIVAMQLSDRTFERSMIFVYNLHVPEDRVRVFPADLPRTSTYSLLDEQESAIASNTPGATLLEDGIEIECSPGHTRVLFITKDLRPEVEN